jgi:hypothetical protein
VLAQEITLAKQDEYSGWMLPWIVNQKTHKALRKYCLLSDSVELFSLVIWEKKVF